MLKLKQEELAEKEKQEKEGVVTKPARIGRKAYRMRKTDFQLEEELAGSLREVKAVGKDDFMRERFDTVFRRNMLDVVDTVHEQEKKRKAKQHYKFKNRVAVFGTVAEKLDRKNKQRKAEREAQTKKGFLRDDLILL